MSYLFLVRTVFTTAIFATQLQAAELIKNPGMEEGDIEWTSWTAHKIVSSPVHSGNKSLEYTHHNWNAAAQNDIRANAGNEYTISLWSKSGDGMKGPAAKYFFVDDNGKALSTGFVGKHQSNSKWVQHKTKIKAPAGTIKMSLKLIGSNFKADLWFDDVSVTSSSELPVNHQIEPPTANNLLKNSGMESGDVNWGKWTAHRIVSSPVHSGSRSLRYSNSNWIAGSQNEIPVSAGLDYKISFWSKAGPGMSGRAGKYYFKDINNKVISHGFIGTHQENNQWINHTLDIKAPKNSSKMNLRLFGNNLDADLWFDDIKVIAPNQPPPTSNSKEPPIAGNWTMTFDEEFTGNALDPTKWKMGEHHLGTLGKAGLNKDSITFKNGALTLTA